MDLETLRTRYDAAYLGVLAIQMDGECVPLDMMTELGTAEHLLTDFERANGIPTRIYPD